MSQPQVPAAAESAVPQGATPSDGSVSSIPSITIDDLSPVPPSQPRPNGKRKAEEEKDAPVLKLQARMSNLDLRIDELKVLCREALPDQSACKILSAQLFDTLFRQLEAMAPDVVFEGACGMMYQSLMLKAMRHEFNLQLV